MARRIEPAASHATPHPSPRDGKSTVCRPSTPVIPAISHLSVPRQGGMEAGGEQEETGDEKGGQQDWPSDEQG